LLAGLLAQFEMRAVFVRAAAAAFAAFALLRLFTALAPSLLAEQIHIRNAAASGSVVAVGFAASSTAQLTLHRLHDRDAILAGALLLNAGVALVATAAVLGSLSLLLLLAAVTGGLGQGLAAIGGFSVVARHAPEERRAAVIATYYVAAYAGVAMPVLGVGLLAAPFGLAGASVAFAAAIGALSLLLASDTARPGSPELYGEPTPCTNAWKGTS
jgi:MFS family permease